MIDRRKWKPLGPPFKAALEAYAQLSRSRLLAADAHNAVTAPLYHYTDARGLQGIIKTQRVWLTHYMHLNDPSEMEFGMSVAKKTLAEVGAERGPKVKIFCDMVVDLLSHENLRNSFDFYLGSFIRERDDLRQWQVYADNGRGFALGFASHLFGSRTSLTGSRTRMSLSRRFAMETQQAGGFIFQQSTMPRALSGKPPSAKQS